MKENFVLNYFGKNKLCSELQLFITRRFTPLILVIFLISSFSQKTMAQVHTCGFDQCLNSVANGNFIQNFQEQIQIQMGLSSFPSNGDPASIIEIPVIVHVIHS